LEDLAPEEFDGEVFRAVPEGADPLAFSSGGGRWGFPSSDPAPTSILYTSESADGAIAEVASYYRLLTPPPSKPLAIHRLGVSLRRIVSIDMEVLRKLGLDDVAYAGRPYLSPPALTQEIGATVNFLGFDGFRAPSARFPVRNLMIMADNFELNGRLEILDTTTVDWRSWADKNLPAP
jgi:hypothetical protein